MKVFSYINILPLGGLAEKNRQFLLMGILYICLHRTHQTDISNIKRKTDLTKCVPETRNGLTNTC